MAHTLKNLKGTTAVIGVDWGDSGKGRLIDDLAQNADIVARYNGGSNTGHTVKNKYGKFALHIVPSGIFNKNAICVVGRGVALDLESLIEDEFNQLKAAKVTWSNLKIDEQATLTMPWHKLRDGLKESLRDAKIGTTKRGVGPTYADRIERSALRVKDLYSKDFAQKLKDEINSQNKFFALKIDFKKTLDTYSKYSKLIKPYVTKTIPLIREAIEKNKNVLFEGAQGYFLDIDAGTYPFVTSSNTGVIGICKSFDLHPSQIKNVIGITKAYTTRVGAGPMPTYIKGEEREKIIQKGGEIGTTSGRVRDPGWLDLVLIKYAVQNNQATQLALTKLDVLSGFKKIMLCVGYQINDKDVPYISGDAQYLEGVKPKYEQLPGWDEDISKVRSFEKLPKNARAYIKRIESFTKVPVSFIGVGPERTEVIYV
ncbi:MAG TPA: adenylosuccinate synthase [Candidatus Saccharimonadales bacterium]|nr:adenylosuccinate synthase [Candidatus Saccharimonadales bacterium]